MKAKIKEKWLEALRSGKYEQGTDYLKTDEGKYCCLGVLCDIHSKITKKKEAKFDNSGNYLGEDTYLPTPIIKWSGLDDELGQFKYKNGVVQTLAHLNDSGRSFKQIANIIEKNF